MFDFVLHVIQSYAQMQLVQHANKTHMKKQKPL